MRKRESLFDKLTGMHTAAVWAIQIIIFAIAGLLAFLLRFDFALPRYYLRHVVCAITIWMVVKSVVFRFTGLDRGWWRYVSVSDLRRVAQGNLLGSLVSGLVILSVAPKGFPRSIYPLDLMICFLGTAGVRMAVRMLWEATSQTNKRTAERNTLIYGAGEAGVTLLREIQRNPKLLYRVCGFVDDQPNKQGSHILGTRVLGSGDKIEQFVTQYGIDMILVAIPSATGAHMTRILKQCHAAGVECKTVPGLGDIIEERGLAGQIRDVAVEDLLGRKPVRLEEGQIRASLQGKVVMVTGAAGSIGSELCRQIARFNPAGIVGFEIGESPLFETDREMRRLFPSIPFYPEIGSIQNRARLDEILTKYSPSVIYHAAAYKHVPLMESHVFEAIENNVIGTHNLAITAAEHGVENFVMISSDKAVRPTNVMGATKRIAELTLLGLPKQPTKFVAVRFGNVLGSNGSVIPIFKKQIAAGGPVTVTHPEMRRFFMTIPEACQLVLQAAVIGQPGQICVLNMGEPVKIADLACNLILLSGLRPNEDIKIEFTGSRPGEKLFEELTTGSEDTVPTDHEKIRIFVGHAEPDLDVANMIAELRVICETRDIGRLVVALKEIVEDYSPSAHLLKRCIPTRERRSKAVATV